MSQPTHEPCLGEVSLFAEGFFDEELQEVFNQVGRLDLPADLFPSVVRAAPSVDPTPFNKKPSASEILNRSLIGSISSDSSACESYLPQPATASLSVQPQSTNQPHKEYWY